MLRNEVLGRVGARGKEDIKGKNFCEVMQVLEGLTLKRRRTGRMRTGVE